MLFKKKINRYLTENFTEVLQTTLNPDGPGAVRIHLIPSKYDGELHSSTVILNGRDILPVGYTWTVYLVEFIKQLNEYDGKPITESDLDQIFEKTCKNVRKLFWMFNRKSIETDIHRIMKTLVAVSKNEIPEEPIEMLSLGDYADLMTAPHRMDLMVSAMTKNGKWHCNQKCIHCYAADQLCSGEEELSTEQWLTILDKLRHIGVPQVTFTGGEPTMRDDLPQLIKAARWFISRVNTNGIKLTEDYCRQLREAELDGIQITFYSEKPEVHNFLVGANQHEKTVEGIKNALKTGLNVSINTPLCTLNRDYLSTLKYLHELGVLYVTCSGLITTGNALTESSKQTQLTTNELKAILKEAVDYCYANNMEINFTSPGWIGQEYFEELAIATPNCGACLSNMAITPSGNVVPCQSWLNEDPLGNILTDDFAAIWENEKCAERRDYSAAMLGFCPLRKG